MRHECTLSMPTFSLSDRALDTRANQTKPQLAVSYPEKLIRISLVVVARLWWLRKKRKVMKMWSTKTLWWKSTALLLYGLILDSGETTCYKHRYCVKHAEQLLQLLEETQPASITTCNTTMKTYTNNSKLTLAIINCMVNNMQTSIFVYLSQVISPLQYWTVLSHIADFPHIVQA